jgi:hypothetical protein
VTDAATALVAIAAGLTAAGVILRYVRKFWRWWRVAKRRANDSVHLIESVAEAFGPRGIIERLAAEFRPNGGSSLRDAIDRIERRVDTVEAFCDEIRQRDTP